MRIIRGLSARESPLPEPELSLGNVVRLKKPYRVGRKAREYGYGIIAEHVGHNAAGHPVVSLYLCDRGGQLLMGPNRIPEFVDYPAPELFLWKLAAEDGYLVLQPPHGHDLYPPCDLCGGAPDQHPFKPEDAGGPCPACGGWAHVRTMRRLPGRAADDPPGGPPAKG